MCVQALGEDVLAKVEDLEAAAEEGVAGGECLCVCVGGGGGVCVGGKIGRAHV